MSHRIVLLSLLAGLCGIVCPGQRSAPLAARGPDQAELINNQSVDVLRTGAGYYAAELENNDIRVLRARLAPGARVPTHRHPAGVFVALTPVHLRLSAPDGQAQDVQIAPGGTRWMDADIHSELNLDAAPCEFLFFEAKTGSPIPHSTPE